MKKLVLDQVHQDLGGKMVDFAGFHMPVQYEGLKIEHLHGFPHPQMLTVGKMQEMIDEAGHITDESYAKKQSKYLDLFLDFAEKIRS